MSQQANIAGKVAHLEGQAFARSSDGSQRQLKLGDAVYEGEVIITREGSKIELAFDQGHTYLLREKETLTLDSSVYDSEGADAKSAALLPRVGELTEITQAIAAGSSLDQLLEETAAGLTGGSAADNGHNFVQLIRIAEAIPQFDDAYGSAGRRDIPPLPDAQVLLVPQTSTSTVAEPPPGSNNAAVISSGTGTITEDSVLSTSGSLTISDADAGQASFVAQASTAGAYGSFTLGTNGAWTYSLDNANPAVQALGAGQTLSETFTVSSLDGTTSSVTVTVNGTNDAAVISSGTGAVTEDAVLSTSGTLTISDTDAGQASFIAQPATSGAYGNFTLGTNGAWTYTLDNTNPTVQALGAGQTLSETFTVSSLDGTTSSVTVTVNGTNDVAVISSGTGTVAEDSALSTSGTLTISDTDAGQASFVAQASTAGAYGSFTLGTNGAWTYSLDNANTTVQALGAGQTLS
jgi:VCBS repeat-containing protein